MRSNYPWRLARIVLGALMLLVMPMLNGMPTMFADTRAYMSLGEAAIAQTGLGAKSKAVVEPTASNVALPDDVKERARRALASAGARSPYFSVYIYVTASLGGMWLVTCLQALLTAATIELFYRALRIGGAGYLATLAALSAVSTAPIFVSFMMPDIFAALGAIAATALVLRSRSTWLETTFLVAITGFSALVHSTHSVIIVAAAIGATLIGAMYRVGAPRVMAMRFAALILVAALGPLGTLVYGITAKAAQGEEIHRPPFLTARILEDGPGRSFLADACRKDENAFELCKFRSLALTDSQVFLWDKNTPEGVFATANADGRIRLARDEMRFVLGALAYDPVGSAHAAITNIGKLAISTRVNDVTDTSAVYYDPAFRTLATYAPGTQACITDPGLCAPRLPIRMLGVITGVAAAVSILVGLVGLLFASTPVRAAVTSLWLACAANVVICGAFSGPFARYETRMSWLFVLAACAIVASRLSRASDNKVVPQQLL
ncbi:MAG: hypothetical protein JWN07_1641 [Hyphomicrobiales bacterium]|nr:hypothetical protein [Hyphomicrobiales bacterium]